MRHRPPASAFTLIEVLVATSLCLLLSGLAWTGFQQMRKMAARSQSASDMALEAGWLARRLDEDLSRTMQQAQWRLETAPLDPTVYGASARAVRLIGMIESTESSGMSEAGLTNLDRASRFLITPNRWYGWEWRPATTAELATDPLTPGSLWQVHSSPDIRSTLATVQVPVVTDVDGGYTTTTSTSVVFVQAPQLRRDRQRTLEDNDFRLVDGAAHITSGGNLTIRAVDDRIDLFGDAPGTATGIGGDPRPGRQALVSHRVGSLSVQWVDFGGYTTTLTAAGVSVTDAAGDAVPPPSAPAVAWWTADRRVVDGYYRDARQATADLGRSVQHQRPGLVRISFTLVDRKVGVERPYTFSFGPDLGAPAATGL